MKLYEIPEGSILLAPTSSHIELTLECLKLNKKAIHFMSFSQFCDSFCHESLS